MTPLADLIVRNEDRLLARVLDLARENGYSRFVPGSPDVLRDTLRGLSGSLLQAHRSDPSPPSLTAEDVGRDDGPAAFGVVEARKRRREGMPLGIFLGLVKLFRQACTDLVRSAGLPREEEEGHLRYIERFFDRNEVALCVSWAAESVSGHLAELRLEHDELTRRNLRRNETLAAGVAHEIEDPIGFIDSNLSTLGKYLPRLREFLAVLSECAAAGAPPEKIESVRRQQADLKIDYIVKDLEELVRESLEGTDRVRSIVAGLKSYSRGDETGYVQADVNECLRSAIHTAWDGVRREATLRKELGEIPRTRCLPRRMGQVFTDLLANAAQAIEGEGVVTVRSWEEDGYVCVSVADTGRGLPESDPNRIIERHLTTEEIGEGAWPGLGTARDIVKMHDGEITVRIEPGRGSVATVRIPVVEEI